MWPISCFLTLARLCMMCVLLLSPGVGWSEAKPNSFNHFKTGFPLLGAHASVPCAECHLRSVFKGTPTQCAGCHNNVIATGKSPQHIATSEACSNCHNVKSIGWEIEGGFNHNGVTNNCVACHNGTKATGKSRSHIKASEKCEACHKSTNTWEPVNVVDHNEVSGTCSSCHNNKVAAGKGPTHIQTNLECNVCHRSNIDWGQSAGFTHQGVNGKCSSCHGVTAVGKSAAHIKTSNKCEACHASTRSWDVQTVDHTQVQGTCSSCHNGRTARGKGANHIQTTSECDVCHTSSDWSAAFDHVGITSNCATCHNGARATGKNSVHIASTAKCEACHIPTNWNIVNVNHTQIINVTKCSTCHAQDAVTVKHFPVPLGQECSTCHSSVAPLSWVNATFDHASVVAARCDSCHNGQFSGAPGKGAAHIPTPAGLDCKSCHVARAGGGGWSLAAPFNHALVAAVACNQCHNGRFVGLGAVGIPSGHFITTTDCKACHTTSDWTATTFVHTTPNYPGDHNPGVTCLSCHTNNSQAVTWANAALKPFCAACHQNDFDAGAHDKIQSPQTQYTAAELKDCSGACHVYTDAALTTIAAPNNGPEHRPSDPSF